MNSYINSLLILLSFLLCNAAFGQANYLPNTVIVKVKPAYRGQCKVTSINITNFANATNNLQLTTVTQLFAKSKAVKDLSNDNKPCDNCVDITLIYELKYSATIPVNKVIAQLQATALFEYVEVKHTHQVQYTPNDPFKSNQYYITDTSRVNMYGAWNIQKGDTNTVIGIVDTGADWAHEDLSGNVKYNYNDPINGIDDDFDGYIDNYRGWDVHDNDNDALGQNGHGTLCAGIAAATTNNNKGISGAGFKCKFLPIKIASNQGTLGHEYEGIVYAADHGCSVINCSWGGIGATSQYALDIIKYATYNRNALVIGAAGNKNNEEEYYPASFDDVVSVANLDNTDHKFTVSTIPSGGSSYNYKVDVSAPGTLMYTTFNGNNYGGNGTNGNASGTSFAAPLVAGLAGLVRSQFPNDDATTIAQRLKASTDNIYNINFQYYDKLGTGRINGVKALTQNDAWLAFVKKQITGTTNGTFNTNDTLVYKFTLKNYIANSTNISVTANSTSAYLQSINATYIKASAAVNDTFGNSNTTGIRYKIVGNPPFNTIATIRLTMFANGKAAGSEVILVTLNPDYLTISNTALNTTITSNGSNGYTNSAKHYGTGFMVNGKSVLYESSFMVSNKWQKTIDGFRNSTSNDTDWVRVNGVRMIASNSSNYNAYQASYNHSGALQLKVTERTLLPLSASNNNYIIKRYTLHNTNNSNATNVYAGIVADWDINDANNKGATILSKKTSYIYAPSIKTGAGVKVLNNAGAFNTYHIDNTAGGATGIDISTSKGFTDSLKYVSLSGYRGASGTTTAQGNDVLHTTSVGPFNIIAGDSTTLDFAILGIDNYEDIEALADTIQNHYNKLMGVNGLINNLNLNNYNVYPNPAHTTLYFETKVNASQVQIINALGQATTALVRNNSIDVSGLNQGVYVIKYNGVTTQFIKQ
jgi:serine protease